MRIAPTRLLAQFRAQPRADVNSLSELSENVLLIVVNDAEKLVQAQLQSHLSTDQRGYSIAALLSAVAIAVMSGFFGLAQQATPANAVPIIALISGLWLAIFVSIVSVWPKPYCFPGNEPKNWVPLTWPARKSKTTKLARFEQAKILQSQIEKNKIIGLRKAILQILSLAIAMFSAVVFAILSA